MTEILFGPPGTGKTTALLEIVDEELTRGVDPKRIGFVSFTKRAATEAVERAQKKFSLRATDLPWFRTLHSLCFRRLGLRRNEVLERELLQEFARWAGTTITGYWSEDDMFLAGGAEGDRALFIDNLARVRRRPLLEVYSDELDPGINWRELDRLSRALAAFKLDHGIFDYTDMLAEWERIGVSPGLEVLVVDESQDLSPLQWLVVDKLRQGCRRVVVAGDDDQAIYNWAGADANHLIHLPGDRRVLSQSYRVPKVVQRVANEIVQRISHRVDKQWAARDEDGVVTRAMDISSVDLDGEDVLIMVRNSYVANNVEMELRARGIIYERRGRLSLKQEMMDAVLAWEALRRGEKITISQARAAYTYLRAIEPGHRTLPRHDPAAMVDADELRESNGLLLIDPLPPWYDALGLLPRDDVHYLRAALQRGEKVRKKPRVRVQTIHTSKGGEAEHVVLMLEMARRSHIEMQRLPDDEARVWYVAVTRARERLTLVDSPGLECGWL